MDVEKLKGILLGIYQPYKRHLTYRRYRKSTVLKPLCVKQKKAAVEYYRSEFGIKVSPKFHEILYSMCGEFKKEFMPIEVYDKLIATLSPYKYKKILDDKVLYDLLLPNIQLPERIMSCCNGVSYIYSGG